jgi:hypothetical protein
MLQLAENLDKNLLTNVLRIFLSLNYSANNVQHQPLVFSHQKPERITVPV